MNRRLGAILAAASALTVGMRNSMPLLGLNAAFPSENERTTYIRGRRVTYALSSGDSVRDSDGHNGTITRIRDGVVWVRLWKMVREEGKPARWREKAYAPDALSRV